MSRRPGRAAKGGKRACQGPPRQGPECAPKPSLHCERESWRMARASPTSAAVTGLRRSSWRRRSRSPLSSATTFILRLWNKPESTHNSTEPPNGAQLALPNCVCLSPMRRKAHRRTWAEDVNHNRSLIGAQRRGRSGACHYGPVPTSPISRRPLSCASRRFIGRSRRSATGRFRPVWWPIQPGATASVMTDDGQGLLVVCCAMVDCQGRQAGFLNDESWLINCGGSRLLAERQERAGSGPTRVAGERPASREIEPSPTPRDAFAAHDREAAGSA
jgi:hypothetical protein